MRALGVTATSHGQGVGWTFGVSVAIHGAALAAILWGWGSAALPEGPEVMDVELVIATPGESGLGAPSSPAAAAIVPPADPPAPEVAARRESDAADIPVLLPPPEPPPPVQAGDLRPPPVAAAEPPPPPPPPVATKPEPTSPRRAPAPKPRPQAAAPAPAAPASTLPPGGVTGDAAAGNPSAGGAARLVRHVAPAYPQTARERGQEGRVVVWLLVGADGTPAEVRVAQSSGVDALDAAAVAAVRQWRFEPARRGGIAVPEERLAPVAFRLPR
jgi:protein TonB